MEDGLRVGSSINNVLHNDLQLLQRALSATQSGVMITDATDTDDPIVFVNRAFERITGYASDEVMGRNPRFLQAGEGDQPVLEDLRVDREHNNDSIEWTGVLHNYRKDGTPFWSELSTAAVRDDGGALTHHIGVITDVTEREETQRALRESEERFRSLVQNSSDLVTVVDAGGTITYESPSKERILGYGPQELVGRPILEHVHPDDLEQVSTEFINVLSHPGYLSKEPAEYWYRHANGAWRYLESIASNLLEDPGVGSVVITSRDITERKLAEERLKDAEARFRSAFDNVAVGMALTAPETGLYLRVNQAWCEMLGYPEEELLRMTFSDVTYSEDQDATVGYVRRMQAGEIGSYQQEKRYLCADEHVVWALTSVSTVNDAQDNPMYFVAQMQDITEHKRAEDELKKNHELLQSVMEGTTDAVFVKDSGGRYLMINRAGAEALGKDVGEVVGRTDTELFSPEDGREVMETDREILSAEETRTTEDTKTAGGGTRTFLSTKGPYRDGVGNVVGMFGVARDITDRKKAEDKLRESEQRLRAVASGAPVITFALDSEGVFTFEGGAVLATLGLEPGWSVGRSVFEAYAMFPDVLDNVRRALAGEEVVATVEIGDMVFHATYSPQIDEDGRVESVIGVAADITDRRRLEQELEYRSTHDPLTGLANRRLLSERLSRGLRHTEQHEGQVSVLYMDLDGFKEINDRYGHETGDELLGAVAGRIERCLRPSDTAARIGGDEFIVLLEGVDAGEANEVVGRIKAALSAPFAIEEKEIYISAPASGWPIRDPAPKMRPNYCERRIRRCTGPNAARTTEGRSR